LKHIFHHIARILRIVADRITISSGSDGHCFRPSSLVPSSLLKVTLLTLLSTALHIRSDAHNNYGLPNTFFEMDSVQRDSAIHDLRLKHLKQPANRAYIRQLAEAYTAKNKIDSALIFWNFLSALQPRNDSIFFIQAQLYYDMDRLDKAAQKTQKAHALRPARHLYQDMEALIYYRHVKFDTALSICNNVLDRSPDDGNALLLKGIILRDQGKHDSAMVQFNKCLKANPANTEALIYRADEYVLLKKYNDALRDYTAARADLSTSADVLNNIGICYYQSGEYRRAIDFFKKATAINRFHPQSFFNQGLSYYHLGKPDTAFADIKAASDIWDDCFLDSCRTYSQDAAYYLGMCYKKTGDLRAARRIFVILRYEKYHKDLTSEIRLIDFAFFLSRYWYYIVLLVCLEIGLVIVLGNALRRR
jgi:tetratricopeptide (TPR) repeat protein